MTKLPKSSFEDRSFTTFVETFNHHIDIPEALPETPQTSKMQSFLVIVNG